MRYEAISREGEIVFLLSPKKDFDYWWKTYGDKYEIYGKFIDKERKIKTLYVKSVSNSDEEN